MKTVAFIPIKTNNERMPHKNTKCFCDGTPLMYFIQRALLGVEGIDEIYVFCSNEQIRDYCIGDVKFLIRNPALDTGLATPSSIIQAFMNIIEADIYIAAHATSPFVPSAAIENCLKAVATKKYDSAFTARRIQKLLWSEKRQAYNFDPVKVPRTQDLPPLFAEVGAAYVFSKEVFLKIGRRIGVNPFIYEVSDIEAIDIDYPEDFELADLIYREVMLRDEINSAT